MSTICGHGKLAHVTNSSEQIQSILSKIIMDEWQLQDVKWTMILDYVYILIFWSSEGGF